MPQGFDKIQIGKRFREARLKHLSKDGSKLTMPQLAEKMGTHTNNVNQKERTGYIVLEDMYVLHRMGLNLGWLLTGEGEPK